MDRVIMIWLDALSSRYLGTDTVPFINRLAESGSTVMLEPMFAFSGVGVSAFTGTSVNTHKVWCDCVLSQSERPPAALCWLLRACDLVPHDILSQYSKNIAYRLFRYNPGIPNLIPVELVDYFRVKEQKRITELDPIPGITTIFDQLRMHGVSYVTTGFYESIFEGVVTRRALRAIEQDYRFMLLKLGSLDRIGHSHGPDSDRMRRKLREVDEIVRRVAEKARAGGDSVAVVIFSDHGMTPITGYVNLPARLARLPLRLRHDYIVFLNSTVAGFWFNSDRARELISEELAGMEEGTVLDEETRRRLGIDGIGREYGELLFALKEGTVFYPDYYRKRRPPRGMHGAAFSSYDRAPFIVSAPGIHLYAASSRTAGIIDVVPTLLDLLGVAPPTSCEGRSLVAPQNQR